MACKTNSSHEHIARALNQKCDKKSVGSCHKNILSPQLKRIRWKQETPTRRC